MSPLRNRVGDNVTENVTENRLKIIIGFMQSNPHITTEEIAEKLNVTKRTILRDIEKLKKDSQIVYTGSAKGGFWKIK